MEANEGKEFPFKHSFRPLPSSYMGLSIYGVIRRTSRDRSSERKDIWGQKGLML